jgi:hypothetical protein
MRMIASSLGTTVGQIAEIVHAANRKWWVDLKTGLPKDRNVGELLMCSCWP